MKRIFVCLQAIVLALTLAGISAQAAITPRTEKLSPEVVKALAGLPTGGTLSVIVQLADRADLRQFRNLARKARRAGVIKALQVKATASQTGIRALLKLRQTEGKVTQITPLWILNYMWSVARNV